MSIVIECYKGGLSDRETAEKLIQLEKENLLIVKRKSNEEKPLAYHLEKVRWYLSQAAKKGLIDREYKSKIDRQKTKKIKKGDDDDVLLGAVL